MSYSIEKKISDAKAAYDAALHNLEEARSSYNGGLKVELTKTLDQQKSLMAKIADCHADAEAAEADFKQAFEAAGYERTTPVRKALSRKSEALAMADELEGALAKVQNQLDKLMLDASPKATALGHSYQSTKKAYGYWKSYEAMGDSAESLVKAIALASVTIPHRSDSLGRAAWSTAVAMEELQNGLAFIWNGLLAMALETQDKPDLPFLSADISPLRSSDLLTPSQMHMVRMKLQAEGS